MVNDLTPQFKVALVCNILGTVMLGASMFADHPLFFMIIVMLGVGLLLTGFAIWVWMVLGEAHGKGLFR
ncbi:MAG: hypothetical protein ACE5FN_00405 [Leptospirillia bacterium]